jgi:hypothetical protein
MALQNSKYLMIDDSFKQIKVDPEVGTNADREEKKNV